MDCSRHWELRARERHEFPQNRKQSIADSVSRAIQFWAPKHSAASRRWRWMFSSKAPTHNLYNQPTVHPPCLRSQLQMYPKPRCLPHRSSWTRVMEIINPSVASTLEPKHLCLYAPILLRETTYFPGLLHKHLPKALFTLPPISFIPLYVNTCIIGPAM